MARVAVAVSGGVDSLCALLMLRESGRDLIAIHGLFAPDATTPVGLDAICAQAGVELRVVDLRKTFAREVIAPFCRSYTVGHTPNPCAICNRQIKFGALFEAARSMGADFLATGHYARLVQAADQTMLLAPARDQTRDQGYFLSLVPQPRLERILFPLANLFKQEARSHVAEAGFAVPLERESQDICFVGPEGYLAQIGSYGQKTGPVLLRCEGQEDLPLASLPQLGTHTGTVAFTIGQRRGLGLPWHEPLYVREIRGNTIVVAPRSLLDMESAILEGLNCFLEPQFWPAKLFARFRYRQKPCPVKAQFLSGALELRLMEPCLLTAPGQVAAICDEAGLILGGGVVASTRAARKAYSR